MIRRLRMKPLWCSRLLLGGVQVSRRCRSIRLWSLCLMSVTVPSAAIAVRVTGTPVNGFVTPESCYRHSTCVYVPSLESLSLWKHKVCLGWPGD